MLKGILEYRQKTVNYKEFQAYLSSYINRNNLTVISNTETENSYTFLYKKQNEIGICTYTFNEQQKQVGQSCSTTTETKPITLLVTKDENSSNRFVAFTITDEQLYSKVYKADVLFEAKKISVDLDSYEGIIVNAPRDLSEFEKVILYDREGTIILTQGSDLSFQEVSEIERALAKIVGTPPFASSNPASSNPYDYIKDNQEEFDYIVGTGNKGLNYMLDKLSSSNDDGLKEYVMAMACAEILGDENPVKEWDSGRNWYNSYKTQQ
ncbi:MAG: hypothetical protein K0S51_1214 [Bacillales bacterium]|jgi:hypothetical protein|nr:hypothetical protein [Bacillales bacterium]